MRLFLPLFAFTALAFAEGPEFEVASIKPYVPPSGNQVFMIGARGGPGTADPTHITSSGMNLRTILQQAYGVKNFQVSGPDTLDSLRFDFAVVVPEGATKEQVQVMWRNLLATRFGMKIHIDQKEFAVDDLVVGPKGHKLTPATEDGSVTPDPAAPPPPPGPPQMDKDGRPVMNRPGMMMMFGNGPNGITARATGKAQPVSALVDMLSNQIGHAVIDKTGLTGKYDFYVEYFPTSLPGIAGGPALLREGAAAPGGQSKGPASAPDLGLDLGTAIQQQLGLRLVGSKGKLDVIVVESFNPRPTEN